ncbi:LacI family DNA-binding transcriptional regulator [Tamlana sp. 2201CG12-4]|uniref:LacI family DNA-binding transcriptional regulator n=1 Tax=Tamlana sp. 2201CG12-4 TaxID=3112582 RepID=UPI002DB97404|nr:LacI family DNA-binding transcriptional regulator [Tamlana sp. 2201CG12-4]MEC3908253.1 LacI family DNA-binding transcriptional regulator [Tamlana sp. 2201CG12-4]
MKHVTIKDIANKLNLSISSVSRAFNDKYDIKKETKELVLKTAEEMGYIPNPIAKKLSQNKTFNIGVVVPEFINEFYSEVLIAIQDILVPKGYQILIMQSDEDPEQELKNVKTLINNMVDGLIIAPTTGNHEINMDFYLKRYNNGHPTVFMSRIDESIHVPKVLFDNKKWSFFATEHLIRQGYKKIYYLSGYKSLGVCQNRINGFLKAMNKNKIKPENYKVIETGLFANEGMNVMEDLIYKHDIPEALFCFNDWVAIGAIKALKKNAFNVPEDVAVMGFTETRMAGLITPQLSSVKQPTREYGIKSAEILLNQIENNIFDNETTILNGVLNNRESTPSKNK